MYAPEIAFGNGAQVVDTGFYNGNPAVFISAAQTPGKPGESSAREGRVTDTLVDGEIVLTFPTEAQAKRVADALVGAST